ncbi:cell wall hydrolase [Paenibacillus sp. 1P07SE]|uniref:cell wall hydrolase n=1 Tax=Paenibacillus sp. 1P07SE TaxID=3132209 RepID=UPI0039A411E6
MIIRYTSRNNLLAVVAGLFLLSCLLLSFSPEKANAAAQPEIRVDGENIQLSAPVLHRDGRLYVPASSIAEEFGAAASWDGKNEELTIQTQAKDTVILGNELPVVYLSEERLVMDAVPFLSGGRLYAPLRELTELLHGQMHFDADAEIAHLTRLKPEQVSTDNGLDAISQAYGISRQELLRRNGLDGKGEPEHGSVLKVVIPSFYDRVAKPYTEAEHELLAKITMVEAGHESYEGQLAIANVILNRVAHSQFPDSIRSVIYSGKQFPPAHNGLLDRSKPHTSALKAAKDALNGRNNVPGAVYFYNPKVTKGSFWSGLTTVKTIGNHRFAK